MSLDFFGDFCRSVAYDLRMRIPFHIYSYVIAAGAIMGFASANVFSDTFQLEPGPASTIQNLIDNVVVDGDVIELAAGDFIVSSVIKLNGRSITIRGATDGKGMPATRLIGTGASGIFSCLNSESAETVFEDLVVTQGNIDLGGGLLIIDASPTVRRVNFINNVASVFGGGVAVFGAPSSPVFEQCRFEKNQANLVGGGCLNGTSATPTYRDCFWSENEAGLYGRAMYNQIDSFPTLDMCVVEGCCEVVPPASYIDAGGNAVSATCEDCPGEVNCYGGVNAADLGLLLTAWGSDNPIYDLDGNGEVGGGDIGILIAQWDGCQVFRP